MKSIIGVNNFYASRFANKNREISISIAKALGIIMVVIGHVYPKDSMGVHLIYCFHMPLFFFLSGYFFKEPCTPKELFIFGKKKIIGLYIPFLKWSFLFLLLNNFFLSIGVGWTEPYSDWQQPLHDALKIVLTFGNQNPVILGFWFLKELFLASVFIALLCFLFKKFEDREKITIVVTITLIFTLLNNKLGLNNETFQGMVLGGFFYYAGYLYRNHIKDIITPVVFLFLLMTLVIGSRIFSEVDHMALLKTNIVTALPFTVLGIMGSICLHWTSKKIGGGNILFYIGENTLTILALHYPCMCFFRHVTEISNQTVENCLAVVVGVLAPCCCSLFGTIIKKEFIIQWEKLNG